MVELGITDLTIFGLAGGLELGQLVAPPSSSDAAAPLTRVARSRRSGPVTMNTTDDEHDQHDHELHQRSAAALDGAAYAGSRAGSAGEAGGRAR